MRSTLQLEEARVQQQSPNAAINKQIFKLKSSRVIDVENKRMATRGQGGEG